MTNVSAPITAKNAYVTLRGVGYSRPFIEKVLPEWWDNSLLATSAGVAQFAMILRQKLGLNVSFTNDGALDVRQGAPHARFKRRADTADSELSVAASMGLAMAQLGIFCTKNPYRAVPASPGDLHRAVLEHSSSSFLSFSALVDYCWASGIPVLFLEDLPNQAKRMAGMAVMHDGRPAIILGYRNKHQARQLFILAHELGHIACGHLSDGGVLIDEQIFEVTESLANIASDKDDEERQADQYALAAIRNCDTNPIDEMDKQFSGAMLAMKALETSEALHIDPGHLIVSYGQHHNQWPVASQALKYLPDSSQAMDILFDRFKACSDLDNLSEENREYLFAVQGYGD